MARKTLCLGLGYDLKFPRFDPASFQLASTLLNDACISFCGLCFFFFLFVDTNGISYNNERIVLDFEKSVVGVLVMVRCGSSPLMLLNVIVHFLLFPL